MKVQVISLSRARPEHAVYWDRVVDSAAAPKSMRDMLGIKDPSTLGNGEDEAQKQREKTAYDQ